MTKDEKQYFSSFAGDFDPYIERDLKLCGDLSKSVHFWRKKMYLESVDLELSDWKKIRTNEYYSELSRITKRNKNLVFREISRLKYTLERVKQHKNSLKTT